MPPDNPGSPAASVVAEANPVPPAAPVTTASPDKALTAISNELAQVNQFLSDSDQRLSANAMRIGGLESPRKEALTKQNEQARDSIHALADTHKLLLDQRQKLVSSGSNSKPDEVLNEIQELSKKMAAQRNIALAQVDAVTIGALKPAEKSPEQVQREALIARITATFTSQVNEIRRFQTNCEAKLAENAKTIAALPLSRRRALTKENENARALVAKLLEVETDDAADCQNWIPRLPRTALPSVQDFDNRMTKFAELGTSKRKELITMLDTIATEAATPVKKGGLLHLLGN